MSSDRRREEMSIEEINEVVNDGGGCTEAWEAMNSLREDDDTSRRTVLKKTAATIGVGAILGPAMSQVASAGSSKTDDTETDVEVLSGSEQKSVLNKARTAKDTERLTTFLKEKGYSEEKSESFAAYSKYKGSSWFTVTLPFESPETNKSAYITWSSLEKIRTVGNTVEYHSANSTTKMYENTVFHSYVYANGSISELKDVSSEKSSNDQITTQGGIYCPPQQLVRFSCASKIAGMFSDEVAACGTCAAHPGPLTCLTCLSSLRDFDLGKVNCDLCYKP